MLVHRREDESLYERAAQSVGHSVAEAQQNAYALAQKIQWQDAYYRTDIGHRAISREKQA